MSKSSSAHLSQYLTNHLVSRAPTRTGHIMDVYCASTSRTRGPARALGDSSTECLLSPLAKPAKILSDPPEERWTPVEQDKAAEHFYQPLEEWQIRILSIEPGKIGNPLVSVLRTVDMLYDEGVLVHGTRTRLSYEAISYCWGDSRARASLLCNGIRYPVTLEAYRALQHMRFHDEDRHVWLDGVCINQRDAREKAVQVPKMLAIFKKAERVLCWLGQHGSHTRTAVELLGRVGRYDPSSSKIQRGGTWKLGMVICDRHLERLCHGLRELADRPWFERVWVKQEIWAARRVDVYCGDSTISWKDLSTALGSFKSHCRQHSHANERAMIERELGRLRSLLRHLPMAAPSQHAAAQMDDDRNAYLEDDSPLDIVNVLRRTAGSKCTLAHDHVYGLLGMSAIKTQDPCRDHEATLAVSYEQSASEVFQSLAIYLVRRTKLLTFILLEGALSYDKRGGEPPLPNLHLPSWTPDWRRQFRYLPDAIADGVGLGIPSRNLDYPDAPVLYIKTQRPNTVGLHSHGVLHLSGFVLGHISPDTRHLSPEALSRAKVAFSRAGLSKTWLTIELAYDPLLGRGKGYSTLRGDATGIRRFVDESSLQWCALRRTAVDGVVVVVEGSIVPLVLRPFTARSTYQYIGPAILRRNADNIGKMEAFYGALSMNLEDKKSLVEFDVQ